MKKKLKIVTIGGGSSYTPELIEGFILRYHELPVTELWLVDIEEGQKKLDIIANLAKRMIRKAGVPIKIYATLNRQEALKDADFVTTQFRVGQLDARKKDEAIPLKHQTIGQETNGPGGMFKALRTIPVILDICQEMEKYCPDAWLINFTNPAGMVTEAVLKHSNIQRVVGLCNGPIGIKKAVIDLLQATSEEVYVVFQGINHMVFAKEIYYKGEDVTQKVVQLMLEKEEVISLKNIDEATWDKEFIQRLQMIPIGYLRYYFQTDKMLRQQLVSFSKEGTRADVVMKVEEELFKIYEDESVSEKPKQLELRGGAYYSDAACELINSIYNDKRDIQTVNTRNDGAIIGIENDAAVEVNCVITKQGPIPITTGKLPVEVAGLILQMKSFEELTIQAALSGKYEDALLAMTINPLVGDDEKARKILDELLVAHHRYLPQFKM